MRKRIMIPAITIAFVLVFLITCITILINRGYGVSTGVYLESKDGPAILISERTPIAMSSNHNGDMFSELEKGDKIVVIHNGIMESYPAKTHVYAVFKINDGVTGTIPPSVIEELMDLGWIDSAEDVDDDIPSSEYIDSSKK